MKPAKSTDKQAIKASQRVNADELDTSSLQSLVGYHLKRAYFSATGEMERGLRKLGLIPPEFAILALVAANPGATSTKLIAHLYFSRSRCAELIDRLLVKQLIERYPINLKSFGFHISPSGERLLRRCRSIVVAVEAQFQERLSGSEIRQLVKLLEKFSGCPNAPRSTRD